MTTLNARHTQLAALHRRAVRALVTTPAVAALGLLALVPLAALAQQASAQATGQPAPAPVTGQPAPAPATGQLASAQAASQPASVPAVAGAGIQREKTVTPIAPGKWTGKRLPDGQPDVQGFWSNTIANHNNFTDPQGGTPGDRGERGPKGPREARAPSRVSDPADGQVPFQPWARAVQEDLRKNFVNPTKPEYIEPFARCAPGGIPKSFYWHGYEIRQYPGYILFLFNSGWRIVHLDGKPALPDTIKLWNADSRGHWEGNTLVVEVTNNNAKARFGRSAEFASENVKIQERYIFDNSGERYNYVATFTDPTVYTRSWTATIPARRYTEKDQADGWHFEARLANNPGKPDVAEYEERICVENNGEFGHVAATSAANALPSSYVAPPLIAR